MPKSSLEYWKSREELQRQKNITEELAYNREIENIHTRMIKNIQDKINAFYTRYANSEGLTLAEAKKKVAAFDVEAFSEKAARYVKNKDFSKRANEELRLYNATMRINRLELLKSEIGLDMVDSYDELEKLFGEKLTERSLEEFRRQAGILGKSVIRPEKLAHSIVNASFHNATFSDRVWAYQDILKSDLDKLLREALIQGLNPRTLTSKVIPNISNTVKSKRKAAERLLTTELCRVQIDSQMKSFERNGYDKYIYIAEPTACPHCKALDDKSFDIRKYMPGENAPPMHPNCRCSTAAGESDEDYENWFYKTTGKHSSKYAGRESNPNYVYKDVHNQQEAEEYLKGHLGFVRAVFSGMKIDAINEVNRSLNDIYNEFPQLKGFIQKVITDKKIKGIASFRRNKDKNGIITTALVINPTYMGDIKTIEKTIEEQLRNGYWCEKDGVLGILKHEIGHALEMQHTFKEQGVDPFSKNVNDRLDKEIAWKRYNRHEIANRVLTEAMADSNMEVTEANLEQYICGYAKEYFEENQNCGEAFAEAISHSKPNKITGYIQNVVKGW